MKRCPPYQAEKGRVRKGVMGSDKTWLNNGAFVLDFHGQPLTCVVSDGFGWEHVSVVATGQERCPTWEEMCFVKDTFWRDDETVIQFHPPKSEYVNNHRYCLHLWRPTDQELPRPKSWMVGVKGLEARS